MEGKKEASVTTTVDSEEQSHSAHSSPRKITAEQCPYPLDIIVRKIHTVVANRNSDDDDSDEDQTAKEVNHALQMQGFNVVDRANGGDCEIIDSSPGGQDNGAVQQEKDTTTTVKGRFKKGHRRAYSMPNAGRDKAVLVVADDTVQQEGSHRRHVVRYRLHPYKPTDEANAAINQFIETTNFDDLGNFDDDELEMDIDEEEMINMEGVGAAHSRTRSVLRKFWEAKWKAQHFEFLPEWLQDNEFLRSGHRPPLPSFGSCFKSVFAVHTETGNIWTHMYGCIAFIGVAIFFLTRPSSQIDWRDKIVFSTFFLGAISCLGLSCTFHTVQCHSERVGQIFSKLDYSGITLLIVGSFIPWIYYAFYCRALPMFIYMSMVGILGIAALIVSLWDKFAEPKFRPVRAIVFVAMGLSSIFPVVHMVIVDGFEIMIKYKSFHWLAIMGAFYLMGAAIYAFRFPERCFPGKCDIWFHSHQIFHMFVIIAAFVHFHGICEIAVNRLQGASCSEELIAQHGSDRSSNFLDEYFRPY
ncbi:Protein PAQR-2 [Aphelenchoides avenae]|nr:Protein PAQR-2 [Aphelenchus avenae]